jgi:RimJ/RimL family protein N-acetyltransferase
MRFNASYHEDVELESGARVRFRFVRPADKARLAEGFARLSQASRYRRFFFEKKSLTAEELQFLTEPDGVDHVAIGVVELVDERNEGESVGIGRFVRMRNNPGVAEVALTVADAWQGIGMGRMLLERLLVAASERGVERVRCYVLADNERMRRLIDRVFGETTFASENGIMFGEFPIHEIEKPERVASHADVASLFLLLRLMAEGAVVPANLGLTNLRAQMDWWSSPARCPVDAHSENNDPK